MSTQETKNILLADDHVIVRNGLKELIQKLGPYKVSGEFSNGKELIDHFPFDPAADLLVLDLDMPVMNGAAVVQWLLEKKVKLPVLLLTLTENETLITHLFRKGVRGYLHKNCSSATLRQALQDIFRTGYYHDEMLQKALLTPDRLDAPSQKEQILTQLTSRELEFLQLVCDPAEYTYEDIARIMFAHRRTVDKYRESVFGKFGVKSKTGLVLSAVKIGIIKLD